LLQLEASARQAQNSSARARLPRFEPQPVDSTWDHLVDGFRYAWTHSDVRRVLALMAATTLAGMPVLVLTAGVSSREEEALRDCGIAGILSKSASVEVLAQHIREAAGVATTSATQPPLPKGFTDREASVLRLVIEALESSK